MNVQKLYPRLCCALSLLAVAPCAVAVDGVMLIDQARVAAAGGFPYVISQPGSYRLASNLTVPNSNTTAISIKVSRVRLDLNGFTISGQTSCETRANGSFTCTNAGSGIGISAGLENPNYPQQEKGDVTIENGTVQQMGSAGVFINGGNSITVRNMSLVGNGGDGLNISASSTLADTVHASRNGDRGIYIGYGRVLNSVVDRNGTDGISAFQAFISGTFIAFNARYGISGSGIAYSSMNAFQGNEGGNIGPSPLSFVQIGPNGCNVGSC